MREFLPVIRSAQLFSGISEEELSTVLSCLHAEQKDFSKEAFVLRAGDAADSIGLVLSGSVLIIQEDIWGNRNILSKAGPGQTFAAAFACAPGSVLNVSVIAETPATVMFFNVKRILDVCPSACAHHSRIIRNLLGELAEKNLRFSEKLTHMGQRTTRAKLGMKATPSAKITLYLPKPSMAMNTSASRILGKAVSASFRRMSTSSATPPK